MDDVNSAAMILYSLIARNNPKLVTQAMKNKLTIGKDSITFPVSRSTTTRSKITGYR